MHCCVLHCFALPCLALRCFAMICFALLCLALHAQTKHARAHASTIYCGTWSGILQLMSYEMLAVLSTSKRWTATSNQALRHNKNQTCVLLITVVAAVGACAVQTAAVCVCTSWTTATRVPHVAWRHCHRNGTQAPHTQSGGSS